VFHDGFYRRTVSAFCYTFCSHALGLAYRNDLHPNPLPIGCYMDNQSVRRQYRTQLKLAFGNLPQSRKYNFCQIEGHALDGLNR